MHGLFTAGFAETVHLPFLATQAAAHATPFPGAKQLETAVSYSVWQAVTLATMLHIFSCVVASFRHAAVSGVNAAGGRVVVVVALDAARDPRLASTATPMATAATYVSVLILDISNVLQWKCLRHGSTIAGQAPRRRVQRGSWHGVIRRVAARQGGSNCAGYPSTRAATGSKHAAVGGRRARLHPAHAQHEHGGDEPQGRGVAPDRMPPGQPSAQVAGTAAARQVTKCGVLTQRIGRPCARLDLHGLHDKRVRGLVPFVERRNFSTPLRGEGDRLSAKSSARHAARRTDTAS